MRGYIVCTKQLEDHPRERLCIQWLILVHSTGLGLWSNEWFMLLIVSTSEWTLTELWKDGMAEEVGLKERVLLWPLPVSALCLVHHDVSDSIIYHPYLP